ncbi:hypothetical protein G6F46_010748 [Rhizopus delemar]|uniref:Uncharacterized protein n=3 Tax=Rhizopus TaxID=4842 RepID=I1BN55_RHIO9|nr:hypothetical protein RO3G_02339 [Rhizopus delemar RA 99-880]KAG1040241.1 hypothetical protein G6F43_012330 [Rhizopus delemar]KAG1536510.1 hypothetical protein G6F51_010930 [Rhizopus arrhizus]KAG1445771.1 hypothetical protein G6F55_011819 [Rhizopus delemar]KAG1491025.1 hypothetical protein G6F54_010309 [Rhizopus delemar]|eukprot:EIE77635.1 hypothetical protein RO3G_02339 [Rhizopus delemar RA 99-880]
MLQYKRPSFYHRILKNTPFITRKSGYQRNEIVPCDDDRTLCEKPMDVDQSTLYEETKEVKWSCFDDHGLVEEEDIMDDIVSSYASTLDKLTGNCPKETRNTAVLIVLSPSALTAGTIARQRRRMHK